MGSKKWGIDQEEMILTTLSYDTINNAFATLEHLKEIIHYVNCNNPGLTHSEYLMRLKFVFKGN